MVEMSTEFFVYCSCGKRLTGQTSMDGSVIAVDSCRKCLDEVKEEGYQSGYNKGYREGYDDAIGEKVLQDVEPGFLR